MWKRFSLRLAQVAATLVLFGVCNRIALHFEVESGVSILFPATAISIVACMFFGIWAALGVFLGTIVTPWTPHDDLKTLALSGAIGACEGLIPWLVFRIRKELSADLRDMKSLVAFLLFGTVINTGFSAFAGNLLVVAHSPGEWLVPRQLFIWWLADFVAALLLATPVLAFGGALLARVLPNSRPEHPRTISNALQIVTVIILLGFGASFAIRMYLLNRFEEQRLEEQQTWMVAQEKLQRINANFLRAAAIAPDDADAPTKLDSARAANDALLGELTPLLDRGALSTQVASIAAATREWFRGGARDDEAAHRIGRRLIVLTSSMQQTNAAAWIRFSETRRKIMIVSGVVDALVFLILVLATATLLYTISRPFAQLRTAIHAMRQGETMQVDSSFVEFRSVAETLEETARELRAREEELRLQTEKALRASQHKSDFLAKMSHELRTPLNSIIGFSDLLIEQEKTMSSEKRLAFLDNVAGSAKHLLQLINDLLDIAKVESGKMKMHFQDVDLRLAIANTVSATQPLFARRKQEVALTLADEPMIARADVGRMEQVLLNLLSNANKFSPEGQIIAVRGSGDATSWRIEVADRGIGISGADQSRIFDEFEQVTTRGVPASGTGLGLALAKRFVEAHGGAIEVESALGAGAVFRVTLPRVSSDSAPAESRFGRS